MKWSIKEVKISDLKEYDKNPRKIKQEQLDKLTAHINEDGYHQRIIVNTDYTIIGGHQRKKALLQAGYKPSDVIEVLMPERTLQQQELDRINVRDNLDFGEFDFDLLQEQFNLEELEEFGFDKEFLETLEPVIIPSIDEDEIEQVPANPVSKLGDVYILGNHRLMCGDSTNADHVTKLLDGSNPILMVTDPPYGVNYEPDWREVACKGSRAKGVVLNDDRYDWSDAYSLFTGDVTYIWHPSKYTHKFAENIESCGFELVNLIIWSKQHFALSRGDYHGQHEPLWYAVKKGKQHNWQGKRDQSTIWEINNNNVFGGSGEEQTGHGTQKPIECMLRPIMNNSKVGESVYDPFGGSGTTLIAAQRSKRNCYMMELSPAYVDVIVKRWEKETGEKAVLEGNRSPEEL
jgi:site-specific DNA-methyltransferase (adenine-specific)